MIRIGFVILDLLRCVVQRKRLVYNTDCYCIHLVGHTSAKVLCCQVTSVASVLPLQMELQQQFTGLSMLTRDYKIQRLLQ